VYITIVEANLKKEQIVLVHAMKALIEVSVQLQALAAVSPGRYPGANLI
jgi:hypothetical protein